MKTAREELIENLEQKLHKTMDLDIDDFEFIADLIIADRKRIVEPLVECVKNDWTAYDRQSIVETLRRAGIE